MNLFSFRLRWTVGKFRLSMTHIFWKVTHDNHICPFITKTFEKEVCIEYILQNQMISYGESFQMVRHCNDNIHPFIS